MNCTDFIHIYIYWRNPYRKTSFFVKSWLRSHEERGNGWVLHCFGNIPLPMKPGSKVVSMEVFVVACSFIYLFSTFFICVYKQLHFYMYIYLYIYIIYIKTLFAIYTNVSIYIYISRIRHLFLNELYFYYGFFQPFEGTEDTIPFQNNSILMISFIFSCFERKLYFS